MLRHKATWMYGDMMEIIAYFSLDKMLDTFVFSWVTLRAIAAGRPTVWNTSAAFIIWLVSTPILSIMLTIIYSLNLFASLSSAVHFTCVIFFAVFKRSDPLTQTSNFIYYLFYKLLTTTYLLSRLRTQVFLGVPRIS